MVFISKIKENIYKKSLAALIHKNQSRKKSGKMTFAAAKKVLLLFDASCLDNEKALKRYKKQLKEQGKKVALLGYFDDKESRENLSFAYYNKKNIDWAGRVKGTQIAPFLKESYDLLINANLVSNQATEYLVCLIDAKLKAGPASTNTQVYDLMIDLPANSNLTTLLEQIEFYLKKINVSTSVTA